MNALIIGKSLILSSLLVQAAVPEVATFTAEGTVKYRSLRQDGTLFTERHFTFRVFVRGPEWTIRTMPAYKPGETAIEFAEKRGDTTNIYSVNKLASDYDAVAGLRRILANLEGQLSRLKTNSAEWNLVNTRKLEFEKRLASAIKTTNSPPAENDGTGFVMSGQVPPFDGDMILPLWFAFASYNYLPATTNGLLPVLWQPSGGPGSRAPANMLGTLRRSITFPHLAEYAAFFENPQSALPIAEYTTTLTEEQEYTVPKLGKLIRYHFPGKTNAPALYIEFEVSAFARGALKTTLSEMPKNIAFVDYRFVNSEIGTSVVYMATGFLAATEATNTVGYRRDAAREAYLRKYRKRSHGPVIAMFIVGAAGIPILVFFLLRFHSADQKTKTKGARYEIKSE